jgi:hypothetical protein
MELNREKQIEEMAKLLHLNYDMPYEFSKGLAEFLFDEGYRKVSEVALETVDDFQSRLRHIFIDMCEGNDYNTVNLLEVDSAIENLFDIFVAELKKKYTRMGNENFNKCRKNT